MNDITGLLDRIQGLVEVRDNKTFTIFDDTDYVKYNTDDGEESWFEKEEFIIDERDRFWEEDCSYLVGIHIDKDGEMHFDLSLEYGGNSCIEYCPYDCPISVFIDRVYDRIRLIEILEQTISLLESI